jgi:hypothetical protein
MAIGGWSRLIWLLILGPTGAALASCSSGRCEGSFAEVGADVCPAMFDGTPEGFPMCLSGAGMEMTWRCMDLIALVFGGGYTGITCYYNASSHRLAGAERFSDTTEFCGNSFVQSVGRTPPTSCLDTVDRAQRWCPGDMSSETPGDPVPPRCEASLAAVGAPCPARFDGALGDFPACLSDSINQTAWNCDGTITFSLSASEFELDCYYDSSSNALVGAELFSAAPTPCGPDRSSLFGGQIPSRSCIRRGSPTQRECPG